ncbi:MAG: hypothetical protein PW734_01465 [Verrucomicrobium sp.]|nr:hypothetical protein [Verrucomicrobium sp.]
MSSPSAANQEAWNEAHRRLVDYLDSFAWADARRVAQMALEIGADAQSLHAAEPARDPVSVTMGLAQERVAAWLAAGLGDASPERHGTACLPLLLSGIPQRQPAAFLAEPPSEAVRQAMQKPLLMVGPDLAISSMTPRHLDYGALRGLASQTWHRWEPREALVAVLLWTTIGILLYHWIPEWL